MSCYQLSLLTLHVSIRPSSVFRYLYCSRRTHLRCSQNCSKAAYSTTNMIGAAEDVHTQLPPPEPSASVILVSPKNEILLLRRADTSSSFPSAHVFPGGNLSPQDGDCPPHGHPDRHDEAIHYRRAAIRELFEESGILLAKDQMTGQMIHVGKAEKEQGRRAVHQQVTTFRQWIKEQNSAAAPDTDSLIPFTHWITPPHMQKRFTTQMYLYFLPVLEDIHSEHLTQEHFADGAREQGQVPTSDGGIEIMEARFLPPHEWLRLARNGEISLFPPQFLLLHLVSQFLDKEPFQGVSSTELERRRRELLDFVYSGNPPWTRKYISPDMVVKTGSRRGIVFGLDKPGPELRGSGKEGVKDMVIVMRPGNNGRPEIEVHKRKDIKSGSSKSAL